MTAADALMLVKQLQNQVDALMKQLVNEATGSRNYLEMEKIVDAMILNLDQLREVDDMISKLEGRDTNDPVTG